MLRLLDRGGELRAIVGLAADGSPSCSSSTRPPSPPGRCGEAGVDGSAARCRSGSAHERMVGVAFVVLWLLVVVLSVIVVALARQVGTPTFASPTRALEIDDEGPKLGDVPPVVTASDADGATAMLGGPGGPRLVLFSSDTCSVCREVAPGLSAAAAAGHLVPRPPRCGGRAVYDVPGTPFAIVLDERGRGARQGHGEQPGAGRGIGRHGGEADRGGTASVGKLTSIERELSDASRRARAGEASWGAWGAAWSPWPVAASTPLRSPPIARRPTTSVGTPIRRGPARTPSLTPSRTDPYGFPMHPKYGYPVDDRGKKCAVDPWTQTRRKTCEQMVPDSYPFTGSPRYGGGWTRCCSGGCGTSRTVARGRTSASTAITRCEGTAPRPQVFCITYRELNRTC